MLLQKADYHIYAKIYPKADTALGELGIAIFQWGPEKLWPVFGYNNSVKDLLALKEKYPNLKFACYSRGGITCGVLTSIWGNQPSAKGSMPGLSVDMYGPAYNAGRMNKNVKYLSGKDGQVTMENNKGDYVGGLAGWNKVTSGPNAKTGDAIYEGAKMSLAPGNAHDCYGRNKGGGCANYDTQRITVGKKTKP